MKKIILTLLLSLSMMVGYSQILPIQLISFTGQFVRNVGNVLTWKVATQTNNHFFTIESSSDASTWKKITPNQHDTIYGDGTISTEVDYTYTDTTNYNGLVYYRLTQTDYDNKSETFNIISISDITSDNLVVVVRIVNLMGQNVTSNYNGVKIYYYNNGTTKKIYQIR